MEAGTQSIPASLPWDDGIGVNTGNPYTELANAIVCQAVKDYIKTMRKMFRQQDMSKKQGLLLDKICIEDFFRSAWYESLCDYDPDKVIWNCKRRAREQEEAAVRKKNRKRIKKMLRNGNKEENLKEDTAV